MPSELNVVALPKFVDPLELRDATVVVIDLLRATTTILAALANGAAEVIPCGEIATAQETAARFPPGKALLGGERAGVAIAGFDLDNSPASYAPSHVAGKSIVLTTTNGTAALLHVRHAARILIGSLTNRRAIATALCQESRPVYLVCAGTDGNVTAEDLLTAGAISSEIENRCNSSATRSSLESHFPSRDDLTLVAKELWRAESTSSDRLREFLRQSRGGRNLVSLGFDSDIDAAARLDSIELVAEYFPNSGRIIPSGPPGTVPLEAVANEQRTLR